MSVSFACKKCNTSLVDKPFAAKNTLIFCAACYDAEFASRCDACGDTFRPGMKKMEYKTKKWHDKCFQCVVCKQQVGSKPFIIPNDTDVYCVGCFEEKFATKCTKLHKSRKRKLAGEAPSQKKYLMVDTVRRFKGLEAQV